MCRQLLLAKQQLREKDELVTAMHKPDESCQREFSLHFTRSSAAHMRVM